MRAGHKVVLLHVGLFEGLPDVAAFQRGRGGHKNLAVVEGLGALPCQLDRVRLFLGGSGVFVHLSEKEEPHGAAGQVGRGIGADQGQIHTIELQLQLGAVVLPPAFFQRFRKPEHRLEPVGGYALAQGVRGVDHHGRGRVLLDDPAQHIEERFCAAELGGLCQDDFLRVEVAEFVHDAHEIWRLVVPPGSGHSGGLAVEDPVFLRPLRDGYILRGA